jgi:archaellum biogenesis ATPase FlaH|tara:strand:- start:658 stop:2151 length:1494 start_codon:yes stop_codon:yes gene_type:complete
MNVVKYSVEKNMAEYKEQQAQAKNYSFDVQKLYIEMLLADAESFARAQNIFKPESFDRKLQPIAKFVKDYMDEYKVMPEVEIVNAEHDIKLKTAKDLDPAHFNWLLDEFETFSRHKALERAILSSADLLERGDYGPVEDMVKEAVQVGLTRDLGTDYFEDPKGRLEALKANNGQISTGWNNLDKKLFGGFNRGELNIFAGGSGAGKSLFLQNLAVNWATTGLNVCYISFELSEQLTAMRLDAMMTNIPTKKVFPEIDTVEMKVKMLAKKSGNLQIKYLPSGSTVLDVRTYLKELELKTKKKIDCILIDYLDLMMPKSKRISPADLFIKDKYVSEELRNLVVEKQCVLATASQLNRASVEEIEFDHSHISGGLSKIQTADNVIGIFTSRAMKERGRYQIQFMKTRSSSGVGQKVDLEFDVDSLRIRDLADDPEYKQFDKQRSTIYDSLKQTSKVSVDKPDTPKMPDPTKGDTIGKVKANVEGGKLRQLLNELHSDEEQ